MPEPKQPCRCKERAAAIKRASLALIKGDRETWRRERAFVRQTLAEDYGSEAVKRWTRKLVRI